MNINFINVVYLLFLLIYILFTTSCYTSNSLRSTSNEKFQWENVAYDTTATKPTLYSIMDISLIDSCKRSNPILYLDGYVEKPIDFLNRKAIYRAIKFPNNTEGYRNLSPFRIEFKIGIGSDGYVKYSQIIHSTIENQKLEDQFHLQSMNYIFEPSNNLSTCLEFGKLIFSTPSLN